MANAMDSDGALAAAVEFWRAFDLDGRRMELDKQGLEMQDAKDASLASRKRLAELTKDFRRGDDAEKLANVKSILRSYQEEIDALTKRCRFSDNAFFSLYKALYTAPDPAGALERVAGQLPRAAASELEVQKLRAELADYEVEFSKLKNQDITIRRLEETIAALEEDAQARLSDALATRQREAEAAAAARLQEALEREAALEKRLRSSNDSLADAVAAADRAQSQLLEAALALQEREAAWHAERDLLSETAERANAAAAAAERQVRQLRQLEVDGRGRAGSGGGDAGRGKAGSERWSQVEALEAELSEVTALNARIRDEHSSREQAWRQQRVLMEERIKSLQAEVEQQTAAAVSFREQLAQRPGKEEVDGLRKQLHLLQRLEYNVLGNDGEHGGDDADSTSGGSLGDISITVSEDLNAADPEDTAGHAERNMEQVIRSRIRRLEAELSNCRRDVADTRADAELLRAALARAEELAAERLRMINRLEDDLTKQSGGGGSGGGGGSAAPGSPRALSELLGVSAVDGPEAGATAAGQSSFHGNNNIGGGGNSNGSVDMMQIVTAQRDRFRRRIGELEAQHASAAAAAAAAAASAEQLQRDNLQLYEKVRFLQSFRSRSPTRVPADAIEEGLASSGGRTAGAANPGAGGNPAEARYGQLYENRLNPFTVFSQREQQRKYAELSVAERITLNTTKLFLSSRFSRTFVFFYVVAMHLVVFATLYHWSHSSAIQQGCALAAADAAAARLAGVEGPFGGAAVPDAAGGVAGVQ